MHWLDSNTSKPQFEEFISFVRGNMAKGVRVNMDPSVGQEYTVLKKQYMDKLGARGIANPNSAPQISSYLRYNTGDADAVQLFAKASNNGAISVTKDILLNCSAQGNQLAQELLLYRKNKSIVSSIEQLQNAADSNGRVHPTVSFERSNRLSYKKPALININKSVLWNMVLPDEGYELWSCDVKNQEPWILAHLLQDDELKQVIAGVKETGLSFYRYMFEKIFGFKVTDEKQYTEFKTAWNAMTYGMSAKSAAEMSNLVDCKKVYDYFKSIEAYKRYEAACYKMAASRDATVQTVFGTVLSVVDVPSIHARRRQIMDLRIQGTGADILALMTLAINKDIAADGLEDYIKIYYTRHDEIVFQVSKELSYDEGKEELTRLTAHAVDNWVPFSIDIEKIGENRYDEDDDEDEIA